MTDRRTFFMNAAAAATAVNLVPSAVAATGTSGGAGQALAAADLPGFKEALLTSLPDVDSRIRNWLGAFDTSLDKHASAAVRDAGHRWIKSTSESQSPYDPLHIEHNLSSASALLDEALSYRRELASLDIAGVALALRYWQEHHTIEASESYIFATSQKKSAGDLASGYYYAADAVTLDALEKRRTVADAVSAKAFSSREAARETIAARQVDVLRVSLAALRHEMLHEGGGSNYAERYRRLLPYFLESLAEAYQRCIAAFLGMRHIYGEKADDHPLALFEASSTHAAVQAWSRQELGRSPYRNGAYEELNKSMQMPAGDVADALVAWCRWAIAKLETSSRNEIEYTVLVPLRQPTIPSGDTRKPLVPGFDANSEGFTFDLPLSLLTDDFDKEGVVVERVRMTGLGIQISLPVPKDEETAPVYSASVRITPPVVAGVNGFRRPPVVFGRVEASHPGRQGPSAIEATADVHNLKPDTTWTVRVRPRVSNARPDNTAAIASRSRVHEVLLAVRIRALVRLA